MKGTLNKGRVAVAFFVVCTFLFGTIMPSYAGELDKLINQKRQKQQELKRTQNLIKNQKRQATNVLGELAAIDQNMDNVEQELSTIRGRVKQTGREVNTVRQELLDAEQRLRERTAVLNVRVKDIYMNGKISYLEVLLNARSFSEFVTRFEFLKRIAEQDSELVDTIDNERRDVANKKADMELKLAEIKGLEGRKTKQEANLASIKVDRENKLEEIKTKQEAYEAAYEELEEETKALDEM
ncbi:MAG: murein hydrolase activator EnvC family protein, partial [Eubacteriales bacterium]